jgi:RNA polymerase sigma-70 factor (ECF subfamily)
MSGAIQGLGEGERGALVAFLRASCGADEAEDVAQEALLRAFSARAQFDGTRPLLAWLRAIAANVAIDIARRRRRVRFVPLEETHVERADTGAGAAREADDQATTLGALRAALDDLPENERRAFCLFYEEGRRIDAIAKILGAPAGTVKSWLHRARERLRLRLVGPGGRHGA